MNRLTDLHPSTGGERVGRHLKQPWKFFHRAVLVLVVLLFHGAQGYPADKKKITFGFSAISPTGTGLWMAKEIGAFDKYGIDASLVFISSGPVVVPALIGGDLQAALSGTSSVIAAVSGGASLVSIASLVNRPYLRLWVQPEINRLEDLRGKTLGVSRFGATTDNLTRILLRKTGLEGAVNVRQIGGTLEVGVAFQHRQIAGAVLASLRVDTPAKMLVDLAEMGIQYSMGTIVVSRDFHRRNPEILEAIMRAYLEGAAAIHYQKETALRAIARHTRIRDPKTTAENYNDSIKYLDRVPRVEPEAVNSIAESIGKKTIPFETWVDNSIVDRLNREGFIEQLYRTR